MKTSQSKFQPKLRKSKHFDSAQRGAVMVVGVVLLVLLLLGVIFGAFYFATHKEKPSLTYQPPAVSADDQLSQGKSNNELIQDARIIQAGVIRDDDQRKATDTILNDQPQTIGVSTNDPSNTVEDSRLSTLQTAFIGESDRRLKALTDAGKLVGKLTTTEQDIAKKLITDETTAITGLKAKAAAETTPDGFNADKTALDKEYGNYLLAVSQVYLEVWANSQSVVEVKINSLGGKYQERLNDANDKGLDTSSAQTFVNTLQANKTTAIDLTTKTLVSIHAVKPGDYNANRSVLRTYYSQLSTAHDKFNTILQAASDLTSLMTKL